jgi:hypothetical protein
MKSSKLYITAAIAIMMLTISQESLAQLAPIFGPGYQATINTALSNSVLYNRGKRTSGTASSKSTTTPATAPSYGDVVENTAVTPEQITRAVQFRSTGTRLMLDEFHNSLGGDAKDRAESKDALVAMLRLVDNEAAARGIPNDLAFAIVFYIATNTSVYSGKPVLPFDRLADLRYEMAVEAARGGRFAKMTDSQRQSAYEVLVMSGGLLYYYSEKAKTQKNAEDLKSCKALAAENLKRFGIEL